MDVNASLVQQSQLVDSQKKDHRRAYDELQEQRNALVVENAGLGEELDTSVRRDRPPPHAHGRRQLPPPTPSTPPLIWPQIAM